MINLTNDILFICQHHDEISAAVEQSLRNAAATIDSTWGVSYSTYEEITGTLGKQRSALKKFLLLSGNASRPENYEAWIADVWEILLKKEGHAEPLTRSDLKTIFCCGSEDSRLYDWNKQYDRHLKAGLKIALLQLHLKDVITLPARFSPARTTLHGQTHYYLYETLPPLLRACLAGVQEPMYAQEPTQITRGNISQIKTYGFAVCLALRVHLLDQHTVTKLADLPSMRKKHGYFKDATVGSVPCYAAWASAQLAWPTLLDLAVRIYGDPARIVAAEFTRAKQRLAVSSVNYRQDALAKIFAAHDKAFMGESGERLEQRHDALFKHVSSVTRTLFSITNLAKTLEVAKIGAPSEAYSCWLELQTAFVKYRRYERARSTNPLQTFNLYLFYYLPLWQRHISPESDFGRVPTTPQDFRSAVLWSRLGIKPLSDAPQPFCKFLELLYGYSPKGRNNIYRVWNFMSSFFEFLEKNGAMLPGCKGFVNPAMKGDIPTIARPGTTNKIPIPRRYFGLFVQYVYSLLDCSHAMNELAFTGNAGVPPLRVSGDYWIQPSNGARRPDQFKQIVENVFVRWKGRTLPLKWVPSVFQVRVARYVGYDGVERVGNLVFPLRLCIVAVALETGLRHGHIRWLSCDFDKDHEDSEDITKLWVCTDKVKTVGWSPRVSSRVIDILRKVRSFRERIKEPGFAKEVYYNDNPESKFGKYLPLFSWNPKTGLPAGDRTDEDLFRKMLLGFQVFLHDNKIADLRLVRLLPVSWKHEDLMSTPDPEVKYASKNGIPFTKLAIKSEISPHSTRAAVVREYLTYLPAEVIGKYITGQSPQTVYYYYAEHESDFAEHKPAMRKAMEMWQYDGALEVDVRNTVVADSKDCSLRSAFKNDRRQALTRHGCTVMDLEDVEHSGLEAVMEQDTLAFNKTHICPYDNHCPPRIVQAGLEQRCAVCPYAVKALDHLPAITARMRGIIESLGRLTVEAENKSGKYSEKDLDAIYNERDRLAEDVSGWAMAEHSLWTEYKRRRNELAEGESVDARFIAFEPEILRKKLKRGKFPSGQTEYLLARLSEDSVFPLFTSVDIKAQFRLLTMKLLALQRRELELMSASDVSDPALELRSTIKSFMDMHKIGLPEVMAILSAPMEEVYESLGKLSTPLLEELDG